MTLTFHEHGLPLEVVTWPGDSLITRARNGCVARFLAQPAATHLMFIDADIQFEPAAVLRMLRLDRDVLCGICPLKKYRFERLPEALAHRLPLPAALVDFAMNLEPASLAQGRVRMEDGCVEVLECGTGFMMIRRRVIEQMIAAWPELHYQDNMLHDPRVRDFYALFEPMIDPETRAYLSEDYAFCRRWRQRGGTIWADLTVRLGHLGAHLYQGNVMDYHFTGAEEQPCTTASRPCP